LQFLFVVFEPLLVHSRGPTGRHFEPA
jgi:hypothetical protein